MSRRANPVPVQRRDLSIAGSAVHGYGRGDRRPMVVLALRLTAVLALAACTAFDAPRAAGGSAHTDGSFVDQHGSAPITDRAFDAVVDQLADPAPQEAGSERAADRCEAADQPG